MEDKNVHHGNLKIIHYAQNNPHPSLYNNDCTEQALFKFLGEVENLENLNVIRFEINSVKDTSDSVAIHWI